MSYKYNMHITHVDNKKIIAEGSLIDSESNVKFEITLKSSWLKKNLSQEDLKKSKEVGSSFELDGYKIKFHSNNESTENDKWISNRVERLLKIFKEE